jgi:hypothetical protein
MSKKAVLTFLVAMLVVFSASMSYANQIDGMASGTGPGLPSGIQSSINPGALGDSLLYGYYNVRGNLNLFNVINTSSTYGAKVRVVFRNAKNSVECLDFSVCLSIGDVWTAYLVDNGTTAAICPYDTDTLTAPPIPSTCQSFKYEGSGGVSGVTADDCREGYFEIVGMMNIPDYDSKVTSPVLKTDADCRDYISGSDLGNVLMGNNTIFELSTLATYSSNAIAVADTRLAPLPSTVAIDTGGIPAAMSNGCTSGEPDYIFMKSNIISPYDLIDAIGGETEVIITFPTRKLCHPIPDSMFDADTSDSEKICVKIKTAVWDDKEARLDITDFSPGLEQCLPYEVNVLRIGGSQIWDSTVARTIDVSTFNLGWVDIDLTAGGSEGHSATFGSMISYGLPAVAYTTQSFVGGAASYMLPTAYKTKIESD